MTVGITVSGGNFSSAVASNAYPHFDNCRLAYYFGTDSTSSRKNRVPGSSFPTASLIGTPTYGTGYADISISNGFDSGDNAMGSFTYIAVVSAGSGTRTPMGTNGGTYNSLLQCNTRRPALMLDNITRVTLGVDHQGTLDTQFVLIGASYDGSTAKVFHKYSSSYVDASASFASARTSYSSLKVGGIALGSGSYKCAAALSYNRVLTQAEIETVYTVLAFNLAARGITIL
jgi:hypothetical protein